MSHRAEDDVGIRAESYSICQRTLAIAVSRIAGTMIIHVFGLCKFIAKFFLGEKLYRSHSKGYRAKKNSNFF